MDRIILWKRLREERLHCGMTQEQVAEYINVSTTYVGLIERGERSVTLEKLILLAKCFHVTIDYLLEDSLPVTDSVQDKMMFSLWHSANEQERSMILSIIRSVLNNWHKNDLIRNITVCNIIDKVIFHLVGCEPTDLSKLLLRPDHSQYIVFYMIFYHNSHIKNKNPQ